MLTLRRLGDDVDPLPLAVEQHDAVHQGEQAVVLRPLDVAAGVVAGAALPYQDAAGRYRLAAVRLDAQSLCRRLAAVADRPLTLLVCHCRHTPALQRSKAHGLQPVGFVVPCLLNVAILRPAANHLSVSFAGADTSLVASPGLAGAFRVVAR